MSESPTPDPFTPDVVTPEAEAPRAAAPVTREFSAWWLLLIVPIAPLVGWGIGQLPTPDAPANQPTVEIRAAPKRARRPPAERAAASVTASKVATPAENAGKVHLPPAEGEMPSEESSGQGSSSPEVSQWTTLGVAMAQSERNGKPVLIDFNAEWCGPCQRMKQEVFDDWTRGLAVRTAVIPVSIVDRRREEGRNEPMVENLQSKFGVEGFPTLVVFSPQTGRMVKATGYGGVEQTLHWIKEAANAVR